MTDHDWAARAMCLNTDGDGAFEREGSVAEREFIRSFCEQCPVRAECLEWGLRFDDEGVYGGLNRKQRRRMKTADGGGYNPATTAVCGTDSGYFRHRQAKEPACGPCLRAHSDVSKAWYQRHYKGAV